MLLADLQINKNNYSQHYNDGCVDDNPNDSNSGWCYLNPLSGFTTKQVETLNNKYRTYYWYNIGSVGTVWKKPPPKDEEPSYCTDLKLTAPGDLKPLGGNMYEYVPEKDATFQVQPSFSNGPVPLDYRWKAAENTIDWSFTPSEIAPKAEMITPTIPTPPEDTDNKVEVNLANSLFTALPLASQVTVSDSTSSEISGVSGIGQLPYNNFGLFYDRKPTDTQIRILEEILMWIQII